MIITYSYGGGIVFTNDLRVLGAFESVFPPINHYTYYNCLATLHCKKREAVELSASINGIKRQIDEVLCTLPPYAQFIM